MGLKVRIDVKVSPDLYALIAAEADRRGVSLGELLVQFAAAHFNRPDLDYVPRKRLGRPRKEVPAQAM